MNGKFTVDREFLSHDLWLSETFTRGQAWIDLVGLAKYQPGFLMVRGNRVFLERGDVGWSKLKLAKRWGWSRGKIDRFINELKTDGRIDIKTDNRISTVMSIKNYDIKQSFGQQTVQQTVQQTGNRQDTNNKEKKEKNIYTSNESLIFSYFGNLKESNQKIVDIAKEFDIRPKDVIWCIRDMLSKSSEKNIEISNVKSKLNTWINNATRWHSVATLTAKGENKKPPTLEEYYLKNEGVTLIECKQTPEEIKKYQEELERKAYALREAALR